MRSQLLLFLLANLSLLISCSENEPFDLGPVEPDPNTQLAIADFFPNVSIINPVDIQHPYNGTNLMYAVSQNGVITEFSTDPNDVSTTFLDITDRVFKQGEMGLLGLAFHPDYAASGRVYLNLYDPSDRHVKVLEFTRSASDPG